MKWLRISLCGVLLVFLAGVVVCKGSAQGHMGHGPMGHGMMGCHEMGMNHLQKMVMECTKKSSTELGDMLKSDNVENRFAAAFAIGEKRLPLTTELISLLTDKSDPVRQASRRSLILVSYHVDILEQGKRGALPRDFGPAPNASVDGQEKAAKAWTIWATRKETYLKQLLQLVEPSNSPATQEHSH